MKKTLTFTFSDPYPDVNLEKQHQQPDPRVNDHRHLTRPYPVYRHVQYWLDNPRKIAQIPRPIAQENVAHTLKKSGYEQNGLHLTVTEGVKVKGK